MTEMKEPVAPEFTALEESRWSFINRWRVNQQKDDRLPIGGAVADNARAPSAQRAFIRQSRQLKYKKWSQARHD